MAPVMESTQWHDFLETLTRPRSVALIGASASEGRLTARPQRFMQRHGFGGGIYPINPRHDSVFGLSAYPNIGSAPGPVDLAYIMLDTMRVAETIKECAACGVKAAIVLAGGFAESGPQGRERELEIRKAADKSGMILIGPNSTGIVSTHTGLSCTTNAAFAVDVPPRGGLAVVSQSGSIIGTLFSRGAPRGLGFSTLVSVGNESQQTVGSIGRALIEEPQTEAVLLFLETIRDRTAFRDFCRRSDALGKPVFAYLVGGSEEGRALTTTHTGAITGRSDAIRAFLRDNGVHIVEVLDALLDGPSAALSLEKQGRNRSRAVTVLSTTGGGGAMVIDRLSSAGVSIADCPGETRDALAAQGVSLGSGKLLDVTMAGANYETMKLVVSILIADPRTGIVLVVIGSSAQFNPELAVKPIIDATSDAGALGAPVFAFPLPEAIETLALLNKNGIPCFRTVESCVDAITAVTARSAPRMPVEAVPVPAVKETLSRSGSGPLTEDQALALFEAVGLRGPRRLLIEPGSALPDPLPFDFPVVAKIISANLPHKSDVGGIALDLNDRRGLIEGVEEMTHRVSSMAPSAAIKGVMVQEMHVGLGEVLLGLTHDPVAGPVVTVAPGGVLAEIYRDASVRPAPVSVETARDMIDEVKGLAPLRGYRNSRAGDLGALACAVAAFSSLAAHREILEAEINPLLVKEDKEGVVMLDGLITIA